MLLGIFHVTFDIGDVDAYPSFPVWARCSALTTHAA